MLRIDRQQAQIAERLGVARWFAQLDAQTSVADRPAELWHHSIDRQPPATRCAFPRRVASIMLSYHQVESTGLLRRLVSAAGLALAIGLIALGLKRGTPAELLRQWPHAAGVAVGLGWWLWLSPSVLGWGIVAVSLFSSLRSGWKHSAPLTGSSVVSLRNTQR